MSELGRDNPQFYLTAPTACPYLPGKHERKVFTHLVGEKAAALNDILTQGGFRRSQNIAYRPACEACRACVSVRVVVDEFRPGRTFRRIIRRNTDIVGNEVPPQPSADQYALFRDYLDSRHARGGMAEMSVLDYAMMVEDSVVRTFLTEYRTKPESPLETHMDTWPLTAVALCDRLSDGISMVYSFYEPLEEERSLGTYMILEHIEYARRLGLPYLYLGYWIDGSRKMSYKTRFQPQEHLGPNGWMRATRR